jgi:AcrR family transcriptional regulator
MGIAERKAREKNRRRNSIMAAAKRLILKYGVEGMSMNQLAGSTELNKATLYLYFRDKDDLIDAVVHEGLVLLDKEHQQADRHARSGFEKVMHLVRSIFAFYRRQPVYFHALNHQERRSVSERLETPFAAKGNEVASRVFARIGDAVRQGMAEGTIRVGIDVNVFLVLLYAHVYGVMHTVYSKEDIYKDVFGLDPAIIENSALQVIESYLKTGKSAPERKKR